MVDRLSAMLSWIEVDLDAVADNVRALQSTVQPTQGVTAVVKAQAYGMGAAAVARAAVDAGARGAAVARISEAQRLRGACLQPASTRSGQALRSPARTPPAGCHVSAGCAAPSP